MPVDAFARALSGVRALASLNRLARSRLHPRLSRFVICPKVVTGPPTADRSPISIYDQSPIEPRLYRQRVSTQVGDGVTFGEIERERAAVRAS